MVENLAVDAMPSRALRVLVAIAAVALAAMAVVMFAAAIVTNAPTPSRCPAASAVPERGPTRPVIQTRYRELNPRYLQRQLHER